MPRFIARPVTVEAWEFTGATALWPEPFRRAVLRHRPDGFIDVAAGGDGPRVCRHGDWVVLTPYGFDVWPPAEFEASFELAVPTPAMADPKPSKLPAARK